MSARLKNVWGKPERLRIWNQRVHRQFRTANPGFQTDAEVQENLLLEYEQKFAELPDHEKLTKLCSNADFSKNIEKGQFFDTLDDDTLDSLGGSCRQYTLPRSDESSHTKGWIRGNTKIGPVLDVMVCCLIPPRPLRSRDHDQLSKLSIWRWNCLRGV